MLRGGPRSLIALAGVAALLGLYYLSIPLLGPHYAEVCRKAVERRPDDCSSWDVVTAAVLSVFNWADEHSGFVAGLSGCVVAAFTGVLWVATDRLWRAGEAAFQAEHRPWVAVKMIPNVVRWNQTKAAIIFQYDLEFQNIGHTIARDVTFHVSWAFEGDGVTESVNTHRVDALASLEDAALIALLPGEIWTWPGFTGRSLGKIHWLDGDGQPTRMMPVLLVTVFYRAHATEAWLKTERFYSVVRTDDEHRRGGIDQAHLPLTKKKLIAWPRAGTIVE